MLFQRGRKQSRTSKRKTNSKKKSASSTTATNESTPPPHIDDFDYQQPGFIHKHYQNYSVMDRLLVIFGGTPKRAHDVRVKILQTDEYKGFVASKIKPNKIYWHRTIVAATIGLIPIVGTLELARWYVNRENDRVIREREIKENFEPAVILDQITTYDQPQTKDARETIGVHREKFYTNRELARLQFEQLSLHDKLQQMQQRVDNIKRQGDES